MFNCKSAGSLGLIHSCKFASTLCVVHRYLKSLFKTFTNILAYLYFCMHRHCNQSGLEYRNHTAHNEKTVALFTEEQNLLQQQSYKQERIRLLTSRQTMSKHSFCIILSKSLNWWFLLDRFTIDFKCAWDVTDVSRTFSLNFIGLSSVKWTVAWSFMTWNHCLRALITFLPNGQTFL